MHLPPHLTLLFLLPTNIQLHWPCFSDSKPFLTQPFSLCGILFLQDFVYNVILFCLCLYLNHPGEAFPDHSIASNLTSLSSRFILYKTFMAVWNFFFQNLFAFSSVFPIRMYGTLSKKWKVKVTDTIYPLDLDHALKCLQREDPSLKVRLDPDSGQVGILLLNPRNFSIICVCACACTCMHIHVKHGLVCAPEKKILSFGSLIIFFLCWLSS